MNLTTGLAAALAVAVLWGGFATQRWITASARCDRQIAEEKGKAQIAADEHYAKALRIGLGIIDEVRGDTAQAITDAAGSTQDRAVQIVRVPVTGACVMPRGLPSLQPAVEEARNAARD